MECNVSVNDMFDKLKALHRDRREKKALKQYVESLSWSQIENGLTDKLMTSAGLDLLDALFAGLSTRTGRDTKFKVIRLVLKLLQSSESASHVCSVETSVRLGLRHLCGNNLKAITEDCIESIRNNSDPHTSWKDILPDCLRVLDDIPGKVNHCDTEITGAEYVSQCFQALCLMQWDSAIIIPLATMFRDVTLSKKDHLQVVKKLCCDLDKLSPESFPPLLYQLLRFSEYFSCRLYPELLLQDMGRESESPNLDLIGTELPDQAALNAHATCIQFAVGDSYIPRQVLATLKIAAKRPSTLLSSPPLLHLLLSGESQRDVCLQIIKSTLTYSLLERCRREEFTWCADTLPVEVPLKTLIKSLVESSTKHCHLSSVGLLHLGTNLVSSWGGVPPTMLPPPYTELRSLGRQLLVRLGRACPKSISQGLKILMHTPQLLPDLLESLCINAGPMLMECVPELRSIVEDCLGFQHDPSDGDPVDWRCRILQAVVPVTTRASNLRDTFLIMCRKGLFSREASVGRVAVTGLLSLLKALRSSSDTAFFSEDMSSSDHSVLTQISIDVHSYGNNTRSRVNNAAVCMEVISQLKLSKNQSWEVRETLYKGIPSVISKRPELLKPLLEMLHQHIAFKFMNSESSASVPLHLNKCVTVRDDGAVLLEPIGALLFCLQKIIITEAKDCTELSENSVFSNKVAKLLQSFAEKFSNRNPADFELDDGISIGDILPESQARYMMLQQLLQICEALIAFCLHHWAFLGSDVAAKSLLGLHKTYGQLVDFVKVNSKSKKSDKNTTIKRTQKSQKDTSKEENKPKKKKGRKDPLKLSDMRKDHAVVFKQLDTIWDVDVVNKVVQLLYSDTMEWACKDDMTTIRTSRSLHRHFVKSCINSVKTSTTHLNSAEVIGISKILYSRCISRLDDFADFDQETALYVVECFHELLGTISTAESNDKLLNFLTAVGGETEPTDLASRISHMCECISSQVLKAAEGCADNDDPSTAKIPPALLRLLTTLLSKLPSNVPSCDKWTEWLVKLCSDGVKSKWVGGSVVNTILSLSARSRNPWNAVEALVEALTKIMEISDDTNESTHEEYTGVFSSLAHSSSSAAVSTAYLALCSHLNRRMGAAELVIGRLKAELQAVLPYKAPQHQHAIASALKNHERALCAELINMVAMCRHVAVLLCPAGACCTAALKLMGRLHSVLALAAQHFITRDASFLLNARFDRVVMAAGRRLSKNCDALIEHVEGARKGQKQSRSVVIKDTKHIPKMVYLMELFAKRIIQLDKKTKLDLMSHMSKGSARDFRIKASSLREALRKQNNGEDFVMEDDTTIESSPVREIEDEEVDVDMRSVKDEVEAAIQEVFGDSDEDGTSENDSDDDEEPKAASDEEDSNRPRKKKRYSK